MGKTIYPPRKCLAPGCRKVHVLRGDYCSTTCRVRAWRAEHLDHDDHDAQPVDDIEIRIDRIIEVDGTSSAICAHPNCMETITTPRRKYCCNACKQDAYRLRKSNT